MLITLGIYAQGYSLFVRFNSFANENLILGKYRTSKVFPVDTIKLNLHGGGVFSGREKLEEGLYIFVHNNAPVIEFLLGSDQQLEFTLNNNGINLNGSQASSRFLEYQQLIKNAGRYKNQLLKQIPKASDTEKEAISYQLDSLDEVIKAFIYQDIEQFKGTMYADFLNASKPFEYPENFNKKNLSPKQLKARYAYQRDHFLEPINFKNSGLTNTPVLKSKLDFYFKKVLIQHPDSIIPQAMKVLVQPDMDSIMFQFLSSYFLSFSQDSKLMGMDKLLVLVADHSYLSGKAYWATNSFLRELQIKVRMLRANLIGNKAPEIILPDQENNEVALSSIDAKYTIVAFWEIDCGHCQKEIPKLYQKLSNSRFADEVQVFAVHNDNKYDRWVKYLSDNKLDDWINVYNKNDEIGFKIDYNITQTPIFYLLNEHKIIVAKNLNIEQIMQFVEHSSQQ